jgi:hypothetical protein
MVDVSGGTGADAAEGSAATAFSENDAMNQSWPDTLSEWTLAPPGAPEGESEAVRVFETAEAALAFLLHQIGAAKPVGPRPPRYLSSTATH